MQFVPATLEHARILAENMRDGDVEELRKTGSAPLSALTESMALSDWALTLLDGQEPLCIFGVAPHPLNKDFGIPWMLGSKRNFFGLARHILKHTAEMLGRMHERYPVLINYVDAENIQSIKLLKLMGCTFTDSVTLECPGNPIFIEFTHSCAK